MPLLQIGYYAEFGRFKLNSIGINKAIPKTFGIPGTPTP